MEFLSSWTRHYRFWDQSAINFLLHGQIEDVTRILESSCPGALTRSRTMTWTACFTIPRARRGWVEPARLVRSCLKDSQKRRRCRSTGSHPSSKDRFGEIFGEMRSRHCGHLLFQSDLSSMELPGKRRSRLLTRKSRVTGSITFAIRRLGGSSIGAEVRRSSK